jgi:hypothetical protein
VDASGKIDKPLTNGHRARMARPRKDHVIYARVTHAEHAAICAAAEAAEMGLSEYIRHLAAKALKARKGAVAP